MIELSTGICTDHARCWRSCARSATRWSTCADKLNVACAAAARTRSSSGAEQRIFDKPRFHQLSELYGYLSKQFTIFGQHVHIGCPSADEALVLLHGLSRYIPHLIALSASSPFVQGRTPASTRRG
jgi:glutamate---cysteine ligase / carboxylate-amine ligase